MTSSNPNGEHNPDQLPPSTPTEQPSLLPPEQPEDLSAYQQFIKHDKYRNTIAVSGTQLLQQFTSTPPYMEEIHRKQLLDLDDRMVRHRNSNVSRTAHYQVAAIINRYLPKIKVENPRLASLLELAVAEANKIELLCSQLMDEVQRNRTMGNVRFVKQLVPPKRIA